MNSTFGVMSSPLGEGHLWICMHTDMKKQTRYKSFEIQYQFKFIKMVITLVLNKVMYRCFFYSDFHGYKSYKLPKCMTISYVTIIYLHANETIFNLDKLLLFTQGMTEYHWN